MHKGSYDNQKKLLRFSKNQIKKAAKDIRKAISGAERKLAIEKIQNFREFHLYPLMLMKNHLARTSKKVNKSIIVARRLKRLPTIIDKLERDSLDGGTQNSIELTRMQDIAGCRAIVNNSKELFSLRQRLVESRSVHKIIRENNYLIPKSSGYGGIHLIYSCYESQKAEHIWKKTKVEVQLRTKLQHAWATSLEIIDTLEHTDLKTSHTGSFAWRRYFYLMGKLVSHEEGFHKLSDPELFEIRCELFGSPGIFYPKIEGLEVYLGVASKLRKYALAINFSTDKKALERTKNNSGLFLITMTINKKKAKKSIDVDTTFFKASESDEAIEKYNKAEMDATIYLTVLLSVTDAKTLKQAYPNYFGSTTAFTKFLHKHDQEHHDAFMKKIKFLELKHELLKKLQKREKILNRPKLNKLNALSQNIYSGLYNIE